MKHENKCVIGEVYVWDMKRQNMTFLKSKQKYYYPC